MISEEIVRELKNAELNFFATLPCEKIRQLYNLIHANFRHVALSREEEGVGISAGAFLAGAKPAMLVQSSGIGNMINALCSLTKAYELPLLILVSWRGVYKEAIPTQIPLGKWLPRVLEAIDLDCSIIENKKDLSVVSKIASEFYADNAQHALLFNPKIWKYEKTEDTDTTINPQIAAKDEELYAKRKNTKRVLTRFEVLEALSDYLDEKIVVCNLGIPCKELFQVKHQKSNFYMLGSMGLASSIGLGIATFSRKDVVVIDGDGSLLTNLGTLSTIALTKPANLTIIAIDNGVHGSTGNQPTATSYGVDLEFMAKASGFQKTYKAATKNEITSAVHELGLGPNFVHILARSGNAEVPSLPLAPVEIKRNVMEALNE